MTCAKSVVATLFAASLLSTAAHGATQAYWRFETGLPPNAVAAGVDVVPDVSGNGNHLDFTGPLSSQADINYTSQVPFLFVPVSNAPNGVGVQINSDINHLQTGIDGTNNLDEPIDSLNFGPTGSNAYTVEASVRIDSFLTGVTVFGLVGRDRDAPTSTGDGTFRLEAFNSSGNLGISVDLLDGTDSPISLNGNSTYPLGTWLNIAVTADANTLQLYVDSGSGYVLEGTTAISGAISDTYDGDWTIGRTYTAGNPGPTAPAVYFDEVRISDMNLPPAQFLGVPEPTSTALVVLGSLMLYARSRRA